MKEKKKSNFLKKTLIYVGILVVLLLAAVFGTRWYLYDSDLSLKATNLSNVTIEGLQVGMNISQIDLSEFTPIDTVVDDCNYNFEELSIKTSSKGVIEYINANFKKISDLYIGQEDGMVIKTLSDAYEVLGDNYSTRLFNPEENNYRKVSVYRDKENSVYVGIVFSRYNNELLNIVMSSNRIKE